LAGNTGYQLAPYLPGAIWFASGVSWLLERIDGTLGTVYHVPSIS